MLDSQGRRDNEEPQVSKQEPATIAWNRSDIDYTDPNIFERVILGISEIWTGQITDGPTG